MLLLAYVTGGAGSIGGLSKGGVRVAQKVAGVGLATVQEISSETQEGIQNYRQKTGDNDLKNYTTKEARKEFLSTAGAFSIRNRAQIKNYLREELAGVVPEKDLNAVVNKLYEDGIDTMAGIVTAELSESESLRNKHGDIYRAMMTAIDKAATQSGAFADEESRAAYVSETAAMFADQVLAEANFRKVAIDEVLKASDIVFEDGGIKFKTGTRVFDNAGNALFQTNDISSKIAKIDADRLAFERKNINPELNGRENEEVKAVKINRFFSDRENGNDIEDDEVISKLDETAKENGNGFRVLENDNGETVTLSNGSLSEMLSVHSATDNIGGVVNKEAIANLPAIFKTALKIKETDDIRHGTQNKIIRYANVFESDGEPVMVKITVKQLKGNRKQLTAIEFERNGNRDLMAYSLKTAKKNTGADALRESPADKSYGNNAGDEIIVGDLIDFVNTFTDDTIKINGKKRSTTNSAGQRIAKTEEGLRAFYEWFGDSKVTDKDDKPLVVYHGSPNKDIEVFDKSKIGSRDYGYYGEGFYFTPREGVAEAYSGSNESSPFYAEKTEDGKIYPVYLKMENPYFASVYREGEIDTERLKDKGYDGVVVYDYDEYTEEDRENNPYIKKEIEEAKKFKNKMWQLKNYSDEVIGSIQINEVVAFEPEQIKSIENIGSFDAKNPNIYRQGQDGGVKGSYSPYKRLIKLTEKADYSTLPHEFAHFWLSEMEGWVNSGLASEDYLKRYDIAMDWLKSEAGKPLSRRAQEQFARGYEQYLLNGNLPESQQTRTFQPV